MPTRTKRMPHLAARSSEGSGRDHRVGAVGAGRAGQAGQGRARRAGGNCGPRGPREQGRNGGLDLVGRVVPGMDGLYRLVQAGWGEVGAGPVGQGGAGWRIIGYGPSRHSCCERTYKWLRWGVCAVGVVTWEKLVTILDILLQF